MIRSSSFIILCTCLTCFKLLFLKSYVSTDFDVHRNWMAITYNLPIKEWYYDTTSEWTLDYPPLFAALEFLFALVAHCLNLHHTLVLKESNLRDDTTVIYQRLTVILSDLIYYYAVFKLCKSIEHKLVKPHYETLKKKGQINKDMMSNEQALLDSLCRPNMTSSIAILLLLQPGLLLVDHIHFQYNGFLSGILLLSIAEIVSGNYAAGSFWFSILLNLKHIYLYCAPAIGMYLLSSYCLSKVRSDYRVISFIKRSLKLGIIVALVFLITYFPFGDIETLQQIARRLFPFKRGLTHAYWAPNIWSLYNFIDKILASCVKRKVDFNLESISRTKYVTSTSGLVQEYNHQYLPTITPPITFILVAMFTVPLTFKFLFNINRSTPITFIKGVTLAAFTSYMFGWHVHEKAIILVLLPLIPATLTDTNLTKSFLRLTLAGTYSLFPLLFQPAEYLTKLTILIAYYWYALSLKPTLEAISSTKTSEKKTNSYLHRLYNLLDRTYLLLIVLLEVYITLLHGRLNYSWNPLAKLSKYDYLPLMLTSSLSAVGITFSYLELYYDFVRCVEVSPACD